MQNCKLKIFPSHNGPVQLILVLHSGHFRFSIENGFVIDKISDKLSLPVPAVKFVINKFKDLGFIAIPTHFNSRGIKTNAPAIQVQKIIKNFAEKKFNCINEK